MTDKTEQRAASPTPHSGRTFLVAFALLAPLMLLWAIASPLMSSPDEPAHAMRAAAVVRGDITGIPSTSVPGTTDVVAPRYLAESIPELACFRRDILATPACQDFSTSDPDRLVVAHTTAGSNSPLFYAIVGLPTLILSGAPALFAMRAVSSVLCAALLAAAFAAARDGSKARFTVIALAVSATPMTMFLCGTINPNGLEVASAVATLTVMHRIFNRPITGRGLWMWMTVLAVAAILLVNTRTIALLWLFLIAVSVVVLSRWTNVASMFTRPAAWVTTAAIGVGTAGALAVFVLGPKDYTLSYTPVGAGSSYGQAFLGMLDGTFDYAVGWIGLFGWLDAPAPAFTLLVWAIAAGAMVIGALSIARPLARALILTLLATVVLVPPLVQAAVVFQTGYIWQGRYTLALFAITVIVSGIIADKVSTQPSPVMVRSLSISLALLAAGHLAGFVWAMRRYVITLDPGMNWVDMILRPLWQPPGGWIALALLYAAILVVAYAALLRAISGAEESRVPHPATADSNMSRNRA